MTILEKLYQTFDEQELAEIFTYLDDVKEYIEDLEKEEGSEESSSESEE